MFDGALRRASSIRFWQVRRRTGRPRVSADAVTILGLCLGLAAALPHRSRRLICPAAALILVKPALRRPRRSRRPREPETDFGGFLDIVLDFTFYGPSTRFHHRRSGCKRLAGGFLLFAFYVNGASFLAMP